MKINSGELMAILAKVYRDYKICKWTPYIQGKRIDELEAIQIGFLSQEERDKIFHGWQNIGNIELAEDVDKFTTSIGKPDLFIDGNFIESPLYYLLIEITALNMAVYYCKFNRNDPTIDVIDDPDKQLLGKIPKFDKVLDGGTSTIIAKDFFDKILLTNKDVLYQKEIAIRMDNYDVKDDEVDIYNQLIPKIDKYLGLK